MSVQDSVRSIGKRLVELCNAGKGLEAVDTLYDEKIVSVEAEGSPELPARMEGLREVRGKNSWFYENHDVHRSVASGPFCGPQQDRFALRFELDATFKPSGQRLQLSELAVYTVAGGKIVHEEFWPRVD